LSAIPYYNSVDGLEMIKVNNGEMGLVFDISGISAGNKPINGPLDIVVDGNSNIVVLSKNEKTIYK